VTIAVTTLCEQDIDKVIDEKKRPRKTQDIICPEFFVISDRDCKRKCQTAEYF
jgi:hypothetical protein